MSAMVSLALLRQYSAEPGLCFVKSTLSLAAYMQHNPAHLLDLGTLAHQRIAAIIAVTKKYVTGLV